MKAKGSQMERLIQAAGGAPADGSQVRSKYPTAGQMERLIEAMGGAPAENQLPGRYATSGQMERLIAAAGGAPAEHQVPGKYVTAGQMERLISAISGGGPIDELPAGYKRLLGIAFDGDFHYETGEYLTGDDVVTMTLDNLSSSGKNVFGSYNGTNGKNFSLYIYGGTTGSYFRFGDQLKRPKYGSTGRRTITFGAGGTSGFAEDISIEPDEFTTPANVYIGMLPNSSSPAYSGDIVGSILVGTRLEWIPCESDGGVIGYYEKYKGNFIAPTGDGTPVSLGYD